MLIVVFSSWKRWPTALVYFPASLFSSMAPCRLLTSLVSHFIDDKDDVFATTARFDCDDPVPAVYSDGLIDIAKYALSVSEFDVPNASTSPALVTYEDFTDTSGIFCSRDVFED